MSKTCRIRRGWFGVAVLQEAVWDGAGQIDHWQDMKHRSDVGPFNIVPTTIYVAMQTRISEANKRAETQRKARKDRKDFENSRLAE